MLFSPGYPGFLRGVVSSGPGEFVVTTSGGQVSRYRPAASETEVLADGFDQLYGVALSRRRRWSSPSWARDGCCRCEPGGVEVLATDLREPVGVAIDAGRRVPGGRGRCRTGGQAQRLRIDTVVGDLQRPQGICVRDGVLYIVDAGAKELIAFDLNTSARHTIASGLPVGPPPGVVAKPLKGMPPFSGPQGPFAGIAAAAGRDALHLGRRRRQRPFGAPGTGNR